MRLAALAYPIAFAPRIKEQRGIRFLREGQLRAVIVEMHRLVKVNYCFIEPQKRLLRPLLKGSSELFDTGILSYITQHHNYRAIEL
eukprot:gene9798-6875_t